MSNNNPFKLDDAAFDVMFDENISIAYIRPLSSFSISAEACVFPFQTTDAFAEEDTGSTLELVNVLVKQNDLSVKPQQGDSLTIIDENSTWHITDVRKEQNWYKLTARGN